MARRSLTTLIIPFLAPQSNQSHPPVLGRVCQFATPGRYRAPEARVLTVTPHHCDVAGRMRIKCRMLADGELLSQAPPVHLVEAQREPAP